MCDAKTPSVYREQWRTARKLNRCTVCRETDTWNTYKHCGRCWLLYEAANRLTGGEAALELDCGEEWEDPPGSVAELAFLTRAEAQARVHR